MEDILEGFFESLIDPVKKKAWLTRALRLQQEERSEFDQMLKDHEVSIDKLIYAVREMSLDELLTEKNNIAGLITFIKNDDKTATLYHEGKIESPGFLDPNIFKKRKKKGIKELIGKYKSALTLIESHIDSRKLKQDINPNAPTHSLHNDENKEEIIMETNQFNGMPINDVRKYFGQFTQLKSNGGRGMAYLTTEQVEQFVQRAFLGNKLVDKVKITKGSKDGSHIQKVFYKYWLECDKGKTFISTNGNTQIDYIRLLTDHFITNELKEFNFKTISNNFHKSQYCNRLTIDVKINYQ